MNFFFKIIILSIFLLSANISFAGNWCKAIYNQDISEGDFQKQISKCKNSDNFFLATRLGKAIRCDINDVRIFVGRDSSGVRGIKLKPNDYVVSMSIVNPDIKQYVLSVTENGFGKRTIVDDYRITNRGGQGVANIECSDRNGPVVSSYIVSSDDEIMLVTNVGKLIRLKVHENDSNSIRVTGRKTQGVKLFDVSEEE